MRTVRYSIKEKEGEMRSIFLREYYYTYVVVGGNWKLNLDANFFWYLTTIS